MQMVFFHRGKAQLSEAELTLYKNISVYNFDFEQSAITTTSGHTLDYECGCRLHVAPFSYNFLKRYQRCDMFYGNTESVPGVRSGALSRRLKNSIMMHTHPSAMHPFDFNFPSIPKYLAYYFDEFLMVPTPDDIFNAAMYSPIQNLIISPFGITIMKISPALKSKKIYERYIEGTKFANASNVIWKQEGNGIISKRDRYLWDDIYRSNYGSDHHPYTIKEALNAGDEEFIKWAKIRVMSVMIQFARESAEYDMGVKFIKNINVETGIGDASGFTEDILRMAKEIRPKDKFRSGQTGKKVYDCNDELILPEWD